MTLSRICLPMQETQDRFLSWEDPLEQEIATNSSIFAGKIPWIEKSLAVLRVAESDTTERLSTHTVLKTFFY